MSSAGREEEGEHERRERWRKGRVEGGKDGRREEGEDGRRIDGGGCRGGKDRGRETSGLHKFLFRYELSVKTQLMYTHLDYCV